MRVVDAYRSARRSQLGERASAGRSAKHSAIEAAVEPDGLDVTTSGNVWRLIEVALPIESEADEVDRILRRVVETTFDLVQEHVDGGFFEADSV